MPTFDLTKVKKDPATGRIMTGQYSTVDPRFLGEAGYQQALAYASPEFQRGLETKRPVSVLSTERAMDTVNKRMETLNGISPTTAPGYQPPPKEEAPEKTIPKAYFTNEAGQEAEYTQDQLRDPNVQNFIKGGGYVMSRTEGPSLEAAEVSTVDQRLENLVNEITAYNVDDDPGFKAQAESIKNQYAQLRSAMEQTNKARAGAVSTLGIRGGTTRYAGGVQLGLEGEELRQAAERIKDINRDEVDAVAAARSAYQTGKFSIFNTKVAALEKLRTAKNTELENLNKKLAEANKKFNETIGRASRDAAVASLLDQGITDPKQLLDYLNFDEDGNQIGDFTAKEIDDTLKALSPEGKLEKLSGTTRDFFILKGQGLLPAGITGLPEDQQLFAYLKAEKDASSVEKEGKTITQPMQKTWGLPITTIGMNLKQITGDLQKLTPPLWFLEKLSQQLGIPMQANSPGAHPAWDEYRKQVNVRAEKEEEVSNPFE